MPLRRLRGLGTEQKSIVFMMSNGLLATGDKLLLCGKASSDRCNSCLEQDSVEHLFLCESTRQLTDPLRRLLTSIQGGPVTVQKLIAVDLDLPSPLRLPVLFILAETVRTLVDVRKSRKRLRMTDVCARLRAKSTVFLQAKHYTFAHSMVQLWTRSFFDNPPTLTPSQV